MNKALQKVASTILCATLLLSLTGCVLSAGNQAKATVQESLVQAEITSADQNTSWDDATATKITLSGTSASIEGAGAYVNGGVVTITAAGEYVVSGRLDDGQIVVSVTKEEKVHLILNNAEITCKTGAPIYATSCDKLIVTLPEGTHNVLTDGGASFVYADTENKEPNAALFCKDDLTINGAGALNVNAGFGNGIGAKDDLVIVSGAITVNAANHALRGNDSVTLVDATLILTSGGDGIQTNNTADAEKGWILMEGGTVDITSARDGMQADTTLAISGGTLRVTAGGGPSMTQSIPDSTSESSSRKGLKSDGAILVSGGTVTIDSYDDCVHAGGNISISGGALSLSTADDAVHADGDLVISGGSVTISASYEGLEAANITLTGGDVQIIASDDGVNAAGGNDQSGNRGFFGRESFADSGSYSVTISGGTLTLTAGGDGIDSNGAINISGGQVVSLIKSSSDNGGLDAESSLTITGGTVIYGGTGTGDNPGGQSTQSYVFINSGVTAGSEVSVVKDGQTLLSFTPTINCQYLAISTPEIKSGQTYEVYSAGRLISTVTAGQGGSGLGGGRGGQGGGMGGKPGR